MLCIYNRFIFLFHEYYDNQEIRIYHYDRIFYAKQTNFRHLFKSTKRFLILLDFIGNHDECCVFLTQQVRLTLKFEEGKLCKTLVDNNHFRIKTFPIKQAIKQLRFKISLFWFNFNLYKTT